MLFFFFFFQAEDGIRDVAVTGVQTCALPILVKQALTINPALKVAALPWSPPAWMKTTGTMNGGGVMTTYFPSLAQYFVKFIQAYQQQGISIYAISVQNEPLFSTTSYPSESLPATDASDFIANHLG